MVRASQGDPGVIEEPALQVGERASVFYTHDECIFYSNEGNQVIWHPEGQMPLRKKGQGRSIM
ncbi:hypothetical protein BGZ98_004475, partial [Dissophora globulifera]